MATAIWWIRRDFRLDDNQALTAALHHGEQVIPLFIIDDTLWQSEWVGEKRIAFMLDGLRQLAADLETKGGRLIVRSGDAKDVLLSLIEETGANAIYAADEYTPYAKQRDEAIRATLPLRLMEGMLVHAPGTIRKGDGDPYVVYSYFKKKWKALEQAHMGELIETPETISTPEDVASEGIPAEPPLPDTVPFPAGESEALKRLHTFTHGQNPPIFEYDDLRDRPDIEGTSMLSPYFRWGMISPRRASAAAYGAIARTQNKRKRENAETWLEEIIWRDFYGHILYFFPEARTGNYNRDYDGLEWNQSQKALDAWKQGKTGYPIVDAAMRQMVSLGWMHNRCRMIVASFLTKDLLITWQEGEKFFMQHLVDGDAASNNGGWQWAAGTGTDAQPYFRIFNPTSQSKKHDPDGTYIRKWVPALRNVPDKYIHEPSMMPDDIQQEVGCVIGQDYPAPIVDHKIAREATLEAYKAAREG